MKSVSVELCPPAWDGGGATELRWVRQERALDRPDELQLWNSNVGEWGRQGTSSIETTLRISNDKLISYSLWEILDGA